MTDILTGHMQRIVIVTFLSGRKFGHETRRASIYDIQRIKYK